MQDTALMLHTLLELGESMLADGADVRRVEQTLTRMGLAYGAVRMDVFVITSSIVLTMCFPDETSVTQTRRIEKSAVTDFRKLEAINAISRSYCEKPFPVQELADRAASGEALPPCAVEAVRGQLSGRGRADGLLWRRGSRRAGGGGLCAGAVPAADVSAADLQKQGTVQFSCGLLRREPDQPGLPRASCAARRQDHHRRYHAADPRPRVYERGQDIFIGDTISACAPLIETILWAAALALGFALSGWLLGV